MSASMRNGILAIDASVLIDKEAGKHKVVVNHTGLRISRENFPGGDLHRRGLAFPDTNGDLKQVTEATYREHCMSQLHRPDTFLKLMEPMIGARAFIERVRPHFNEIVMVTSTMGADESCLRHFSSKHGIEVDTYVLTHGDSKQEYYGMCAVVVDDEAKHLVGLPATVQRIFMTRPEGSVGWRYAQTRPLPDLETGVEVAGSLDQAADLVFTKMNSDRIAA